MFAKLFDNISPRNLLNGLLFLALLACSYWTFPIKAWQWYPSEFVFLRPANSLFAFISLFLILLLSSWLFAESQNRRRSFEGQYLSLVGAGVLFWLWIYPLNAGSELWSLIIFGSLISVNLGLLKPEVNSSSKAYISGFLVAASGFLSGELLALIIIPFALLIALRRFNGRTLLAVLLGYGSALYFAFSIDFLFDTFLIESWWDQILNLSLFNFETTPKRIVLIAIMAVYIGLSVLVLLSSSHQYNNEQKKEINYWIFMMMLGISGFFIFESSNLWLGLCLYPAATLGTLAVQSVRNRWLKDALFILPLLAYLSTFFV